MATCLHQTNAVMIRNWYYCNSMKKKIDICILNTRMNHCQHINYGQLYDFRLVRKYRILLKSVKSDDERNHALPSSNVIMLELIY